MVLFSRTVCYHNMCFILVVFEALIFVDDWVSVNVKQRNLQPWKVCTSLLSIMVLLNWENYCHFGHSYTGARSKD